MKKSTWALLAGGVVVTVGALAWAFAPRPVAVETAVAHVAPFETGIEEDGKTRVRDRYVVSAPLAGSLQRIALKEGDTVEAGALVATLMPALSPMLDERTLQEQRARVEVAEANVSRAGARIEAARVALQQARNELQRSQELARQGFVAATKHDSDQLAVKGAEKELDAAQQERHAAQHETEQARAALSAVQQPGSGRSFAVRAPVSGRVLRVVQASEGMVGLGAPLIELGDVHRLEVVAELLTSDALRARPGSPVVIDRWGGDRPLEGRVRLVEPGAFTKISALGVEEQRVRVLMDILTPAEQWQALGDGYRVAVRIVTQQVPQALQVPVSAVFPRPEQAGAMAVFVVRDGRAHQQAVDLAARNGSTAWVRSGLKAGEEVVVYPPPAVADGVRVRQRKV
jgi:HlyD family secretion protein